VLLDAAADQGLRGLVAKRLDARYRPGTTSTDWIVLDGPAGDRSNDRRSTV
jgi:ATP-dependent DNA ligase